MTAERVIIDLFTGQFFVFANSDLNGSRTGKLNKGAV